MLVIPFSAKDLATVKMRAMTGGVLEKLSTLEALAGHVWQACTCAINSQPDDTVQLLYAMDVRDCLDPPLLKGFVGNTLYSACARATCEKVRKQPLSFCVKEIQKANKKSQMSISGSVQIQYFHTCWLSLFCLSFTW